MSEEDNEQNSFTITQNDLLNHRRLDTYLSEKLPEISRSLIKKLHSSLHIKLADGSIPDLKKMPILGSTIVCKLPSANKKIIPQDIHIDVLFEDQHLIIVNKPAGMVTHPAPGSLDQTLVNAMLFHNPSMEHVGDEARPGIVHRLDKGTSGIMVVAKTQACYNELVKLFSAHDLERLYEAIVLGAKVPPQKTLESLIGRSASNRLKMTTQVEHGKKALTHLKVLNYFEYFSHVELKLETGRTHQIRVHLSELLNSPILNDPLYGRKNDEKRFLNSTLKSLLKGYEHPLLHAKKLAFVHPMTKEFLEFSHPAPKMFQDAITALNKN